MNSSILIDRQTRYCCLKTTSEGGNLDTMRFKSKSLQLKVDSVYTLLIRQRSLRHLRRQTLNLDGLVCSPGGVATSAIMSHLEKYVDINSPGDSDGLKHLPNAAKVPDSLKVLFLTGDPESAVASLKRRGYDLPHVFKLGGLWAFFLVFFPSKWDSALKAFITRQTLEFSSIPSQRCLVISYDQLWERKAEIARFFGLEGTDFVSTFPPKRERHGKSDGTS